MLSTGQSSVYRYSLYYSFNFSVELIFFQNKELDIHTHTQTHRTLSQWDTMTLLLEWLKQENTNNTKGWQGCKTSSYIAGWDAKRYSQSRNILPSSYKVQHIYHMTQQCHS